MPRLPEIVRSRAALGEAVGRWRANGETHALVPTMGALHDGHLALVRLARQHCPRVAVSIFVNPTQFAPTEDLSRYPRDEAGDLAKLAAVDCDLVWAPDPAEMYPPGFATRIVPEGAALGLESDFRPHFFAGVATVCCKLFTQVAPNSAIFGEKDFQQLCVVRQLVRDLDLPLTIIGAPTLREQDGLAMSSRNRYLSPEERRIAPLLHSVLTLAGEAIQGGSVVADECQKVIAELNQGGFKADYVSVRDAETLAPATPGRPWRILAAAWLGKTRLIDNLPIPPR
jgi:pantoate--beta-alanine ligase